MATEIELKLAVPPRALRDAACLPWLRKLANGSISQKKVVSVYFDTRKFKLRNHGLTLRVRKVGGKRLQTIKASANGSDIFHRQEWEQEIAADKPQFKLAKGTALEPLVSRKLKKSLQAVFETDVRRLTMPVRVGGSELELAFDSGRIRTGGRSEQISEIELELKQGDRADLARLSERLSRAIPASYGARSKAERGYALSAAAGGKPARAGKIDLAATASTGEAFSAIGLSCLHHVAANEGAVRNSDSEGVHQMRVGLRRLRAAISVFKDVVQGDETEKIKTELKWLTEQLAPARDFDVLVKNSVVPLRNASHGQPEVSLLEADLAKKRDQGFERARAAVTGERYRHVMLATALWLINGEWTRNEDPLRAVRRGRPVTSFAQDVMNRRTKKIVKKIKKLGKLDARQRHKLRIAVKKLRYATDFFASLFARSKAKKGRKRFGAALKALQDALGRLNDISVHEKLAKQFAHPGRRSNDRPQKAYAMGLLTGRERHIARACSAAAGVAGKNMSKAKIFWR